ncbi:ATP-binding cassette domain-containing protein [uncultured Eubacterium sp.]|uniref:ATP-binding cassette domain-containing protein n=1 Tax=uncultured Eubacterium sp. TaxID=165185 RepID=UPI000E7E2B81|nr:ABC transporter ATP-binding protein [uncultured Eubacterium sp.]HAV90391.1 ABC transporter ATP-binding protein [Eubacterium sp.]
MNNNGKTLKVEGLNKRIGDFELKDISFELKPGVVTGLIGVNGCGKTTLMRTLMGSYIKDSGKLSYVDDKGNENEVSDIKKELGFILESFPFSKNYSAENIGKLYGIYYDDFDYKKYIDLLKEYKVPLGKANVLMSTGERIRIEIAFALSHKANIYVMDEPVGNLDVVFRDKFYKIIREIVSDEVSSVLISSHIIGELEDVIDEVIWMNDGNIFFNGSIEELRDSYRILEVDKEDVVMIPSDMVVGSRVREYSSEVLIKVDDENELKNISESIREKIRFAELKEIIYFVEKTKENKEV